MGDFDVLEEMEIRLTAPDVTSVGTSHKKLKKL